VRRTESTLREFGPATFPVYAEAEIVGVRALASILNVVPSEELERFIQLYRSGTPVVDPPESGTPDDSGPATGDPPAGHSVRSPKEELRARYAEFIRTRSAP
jgi:hypothetical protein